MSHSQFYSIEVFILRHAWPYWYKLCHGVEVRRAMHASLMVY